MQISKRVLAVLVLLAAAVSLPAEGVAQDRGQDAIASRLDRIFADARLDLRAPGMVYGVVRDGELAHVGTFGVRSIEDGAPVTGTTAFRIASMTKMMTALLIGDLADRGELRLDAPAELYVPALKDWEYPTTDSRRVTVRDLLNHTAGFIWDDPWADRQMHRTREELDAFLARAEPFTAAPGDTWSYSNLGYAILGRIIENVSGRSFAEQLELRIFEPLGMDDSTLEVAEIDDADRAFGYNWIDDAHVLEPVLASGSFDPLGGVWTTAEDYGRFVAWFLSAWPPRDDADPFPIPRRVVRSVTDAAYVRAPARRSGLTGAEDCVMSVGYAMGLAIQRHCEAGLMLSHGGGFPGYGTHVVMMPEQGLGVFAFANRTYAGPTGPVWDAAVALVDAGYGEAPAPLPPDARLLEVYHGVVRAWEAGRIRVPGLAFADNFVLDRSAERWDRQLAAIKQVAGACETEPLAHDGRLSGAFSWDCERARVTGYLTVSPIDPSTLQMLHIRAATRDGAGRDLRIDFNWH